MSYSWDKFLKPLSDTDTNIQILDNNNVVTHTINPFVILNVLINNNLIKVSLKSGRVITIPFSTLNESKLALPRIKQYIDTLNKKVPLFVNNELKNYVNDVTDTFFYQSTIPTGTGTESIKTGTLWYDTEFGFLYVYVNDELSGYNWVTAVGEVGATGPIGPTGPAGATGSSAFDGVISQNNISNPTDYILFNYDSTLYNGANINLVEVDVISGDSTTYNILVANNSNISVSSNNLYISTIGTAPTTISATISGSDIQLIVNGSGEYDYRGNIQLL